MKRSNVKSHDIRSYFQAFSTASKKKASSQGQGSGGESSCKRQKIVETQKIIENPQMKEKQKTIEKPQMIEKPKIIEKEERKVCPSSSPLKIISGNSQTRPMTPEKCPEPEPWELPDSDLDTPPKAKKNPKENSEDGTLKISPCSTKSIKRCLEFHELSQKESQEDMEGLLSIVSEMELLDPEIDA